MATLYVSKRCNPSKKIVSMIQKANLDVKLSIYEENKFPFHISSTPSLEIDNNILAGKELFDYINDILSQMHNTSKNIEHMKNTPTDNNKEIIQNISAFDNTPSVGVELTENGFNIPSPPEIIENNKDISKLDLNALIEKRNADLNL